MSTNFLHFFREGGGGICIYQPTRMIQVHCTALVEKKIYDFLKNKRYLPFLTIVLGKKICIIYLPFFSFPQTAFTVVHKQRSLLLNNKPNTKDL